MHERAFVLLPLAEVSPDAGHTRARERGGAGWRGVADQGVTRIDG